MRVEAEFCISHGDEMKLIGIKAICLFPEFMEDFIARMSRQCIDDVIGLQSAGKLGENAHLVTHPNDMPISCDDGL